MSLPAEMRGVIIESTGGAEVLQYKTDLSLPVPKAGEVLIKNSFVGVNFIDINYRTGLYPSPKPYILGCEGEGTVASISAEDEHASGLKAGDHVAWLSLSNGGYAEYTACSMTMVARIPPTLTPGVAAATLSQGLTALTLIEKAYVVQKGDWILVQGASGGVGVWLCRVLASIAGARVIGVVSTTDKVAKVRESGADFVLCSREEDVEARVMDITGGEDVAAVFDSVGKETFDLGLKVLARDGTMVSYGNASGNVTGFNIDRLREKNLRLMRPSIFGYLRHREEFVRFVEKLFKFIGSLENEPALIGGEYALDQVMEAHRDLEGRRSKGKLVLKL